MTPDAAQLGPNGGSGDQDGGIRQIRHGRGQALSETRDCNASPDCDDWGIPAQPERLERPTSPTERERQ